MIIEPADEEITATDASLELGDPDPQWQSASLPVRDNAKTVLAIVLTCYFMIVLDISIVVTGLPDIREGLGFSPVGLSWVQNAYLLCFGGFLLMGARAGDLFGRKRMLLWGLSVFTVASLAIGLAQAPSWLILGRAVQGIGAAILAPTVLSLISTTFAEGPARTKALAYYSMVAGAGSTFGLVVGGIFADQLSWRVGFLINVPIGIGLYWVASKYLTNSASRPGKFDLLGSLGSTIGMGALVFGIIRTAEVGWSDPLTLAAISVAVVLLTLFIINEGRADHPMLPYWLFLSRERSGAYVSRMLFLGAMVSFFFFTTQFMQEVFGFSPLMAGIGFLPVSVPTFISAMAVPRMTNLFGNGIVVALALGLSATGMLWLGQADAGGSYWWDIALPMLFVGFGNGFALGPLTVAGVSGVPDEHQGAASGAVNVAHQLGGTLGLSALVLVFASADLPSIQGVQLLAHRIDAATTGGGVMLCIALVVAILFVLPAEKPKFEK